MTIGRPDPRKATTPAAFLAALHELRRWAGQPSLRKLTELAGKATVDGRAYADRLPLSTLSDNLAGKRLPNPPRPSFVRVYVEACMRARGYDEQDIPAVADRWEQALDALSGTATAPRVSLAAFVRRLAIVGVLVLVAVVAVAPARLATISDAAAPLAPYVAGKPPVSGPPGVRTPSKPVRSSFAPPVAIVRHTSKAPRPVTPPPRTRPPAARQLPPAAQAQPDYYRQYQAFSDKLRTGLAQQQQAYDPKDPTPWNPND